MGIRNPFRTGAGDVKRAAANAAAARQGRASNMTMLTDMIFNDPSRERGIQDFMGAMRAQRADATNRGFTKLARRTRFNTARQSLTGGSTDATRQREDLEGLFSRRLGDESAVLDAGNTLRDQDRSTRQSLINSAYGTADIGQDALRNLLGQRASLSRTMAGLLPQHLADTAEIWKDAYSPPGGS